MEEPKDEDPGDSNKENQEKRSIPSDDEDINPMDDEESPKP